VSNGRWVLLTVGAFVGVTAVVSSLLWAAGLLNFSGTQAAANVLVAVLALVGTLFGTIVTLVGLMLKRSLDARTLVLQAEAEARLNLDTAIKAVELFKSASGSASPEESAGALFALTRLGQTHFALALLQELWPKGKVESPSAVWVINSCLQSTDVGAADRAATILQENARRLPDGREGKCWPADYDLEWPRGISFFARYCMLQARIEALLAKPFDYWNRDILSGDIFALSNCLHTEESPLIKQSAAAFLAILLKRDDFNEGSELYLPTGRFVIREKLAEIEGIYGLSFPASSDRDRELQTAMTKWVKRLPYFETSPAGAESPSGE
jgi:hypothetical protein